MHTMQPTEMIPCRLRFCISILTNTKQYILNFINICLSKLALCDVIIATGRLKTGYYVLLEGCKNSDEEAAQKLRIKRPDNRISQIMELT